MEDKYRKSGIDTIGDIPWGTHMCQLYRTKDDLIDILVPYFRAGLENNEFCMWVTSEPLGVKEAKAALGKAVRHFDDYISTGQMEILDYSEWYTKSGKFNADEVLKGWVEKEREALEKGFDGLRLTGNTLWLGPEDWVAFREYEATLDSIIGEHRMIAIGTYSLDRCAASEVLDVLNNHETTFIKRKGGWRTIESDERKRLRKVLSSSEVRFRRLFETAQDGILILDADTGQITEVNPFIKDMLGYTAEELVGKKLWEIGLFKDIVKSKDAFKKLLGEGYIRYEDLQLGTKDGEPVDVEFVSNVYDVGHKKIIQCNIRDISQRKEAQEVSRQQKDELEKIVKRRTGELEESNRKLWQELTERKQAEEALRISEERLRNLVENVPIGIVVTTTSGDIIDANRALLAMTGYDSKEEFMKTPVSKRYYDPKDRDKWIALLREKDKVEGFEVQLTHKDGTPYWALFNAIPWPTASSGNQQFIIVVQDINEHKLAEETLRESEKFTSSLLENAPNPIIVTNPDTSVRYVNPAFEKLTGYSKAELIGSKPPRPFWPEEKREQHRRSFEQDMLGIASRQEAQFQKKNGEMFRVEMIGVNIKDNGKLKYRLTHWVDITERRQTEEKTRQAAEEWRTTFDSITDLISIHDKDFRLTRVNKAFANAFNMKPEELIGKACYQVVHGTNEPLLGCPHKATLENKEPAVGEFLESHLGISLEVATSPVFNDKGEVVASVHVARDVTERKKMQEQLIVTDRLASIGQLSSGIAHELNNPLTSVIGFSELLMEKDIPKDVKEDLETINREAKRTANIVKGLLMFARKQKADKEPIDIKSIIQGVLQLRSYEHKVSNIEVDTRFASDLPQIMGNGAQLQQVVINLVVNAEQAMLEAQNRGKLTIITERVGDIVRITLADDGPGISPENMRKLFTPFFTTKEVGKGTGLGLSICHGIINEHGGNIHAESEPGKGATFIIELPISK